MLRLYDNHLSGNGYKPRLLLAHLGRTYERIEVDILKGETRTPEFLARNPNGRIPVLELEDGTCIAESNAILFYLAEGSPFLPSGRLDRALTLQWMFFEQYSHEPCIAVARHWIQHVEMTEAQWAQLPDRQEGGRAALAVMERHLDEVGLVRRGCHEHRRLRALCLYPRRRTRAGSISRTIRPSAPGSPGSRRSRDTSRCIPHRKGSSTRWIADRPPTVQGEEESASLLHGSFAKATVPPHES